jgi:hypothetical protein
MGSLTPAVDQMLYLKEADVTGIQGKVVVVTGESTYQVTW